MIAESGARRDITEPEGAVIVGTKIRSSINPGTVVEVDERELVDLDRQGLIHSHELDAKSAEKTGVHKSAKRWKDGDAEEVESGVVEFGKPDETEGSAE